jgi:hypothetical protein
MALMVSTYKSVSTDKMRTSEKSDAPASQR